MSHTTNFLSKKKSGFIIVSFLIIYTTNSYSQIIPKINKTINDAANLAYSVAKLTDATKRTIAEFNKNVVVVNESNPRPEISPDQITKPKYKKGEFTNFSWEPIANFNNQLFPSMIISMASYEGPIPTPFMSSVKSSSLGFRLVSNKSYIPLKWEIECVDKKFFDKVSGDVMFEQAGKELYFMPNIPWNFEALNRNFTSAPTNFYFRLFDDQGNKVEKLQTLTIRSVNDCIFMYKGQPLKFLFTAYVQEEHPAIDQINKAALDSKMIPAIVGYQWGESYVDLQVAAIWRVLHDRGFQYSSITDNSGINDVNEIYSQTVRTFDNSLKTSQANCVDGTVVLASILKQIGIKPILITVPGHCFLGYYSNEKDTSIQSIRFLETTMLSLSNYMSKDSVIKYKKILTDNYPKEYFNTATEKDKEYFLQFLLAKFEGENKWKHNNELYGPDQISRLNVSYWRKYVQPLPISN